LININRVWAMPNKWTFQIPPITDLLARYVGDGKGWVDPFAGMNSPAEFTNDINPEAPTLYHDKAIDFVSRLAGAPRNYVGILFDPPYSLRQVKECYELYGIEMNYDETITYFSRLKTELAKFINWGGLAISFGWNSCGFGKVNGFELIEILLVCHGRDHNDTIVTVERKVQGQMIKR
jgi:hypothetical protein